MKEIGLALITMRKMVDSFVVTHDLKWEKVRMAYREEHGFDLGRPLSLQSFLGSDLTIDMAYLANDIETRDEFTNEYWIRSQGMQCIRTDEDREANMKCWSDVLAKFRVTKDKDGEISFEWFEDEKCRVHNKLIDENKLYYRW